MTMADDYVDPTNSQLQEYEERRIFDEFVEYAELPVVVESIQSRRNREPDIYCEMVGGERVAYELGELCDEGFRRGHGTMLQSRELLQQGFSNLEPSTREKFVQKYPDAFISVQFVPAAPLRRRAQSVVALYQWLLQSGPASGELDDTLLPAQFSDNIAGVLISRNPPQLVIEPGFATAVSPPTLRILDKKTRTRYVTDGRPIELLLYAQYAFMSLDNWLQGHADKIREKLIASEFRCAWVFFVSDRTTNENALAKISREP